MLSANNTAVLFYTSDGMNDEARKSLPTCLTNMFLWLQVHFMYAFFIECVLSCFIVVPMIFYDLFSRTRLEERRRLFNNFLNGSIANGQQSHCRCRILIEQITSIIVYISVAFFYTRIRYYNSLEVITSRTVLHWLIEASLGPSFAVFLMDMFDMYPQFIIYDQPERLSYTPIFYHKILLFTVMRYVETYPSSSIQIVHSFFFKMLCDTNFQISSDKSSNEREL